MNKLIEQLRRLYFLPESPLPGQCEASIARSLAGEKPATFDLVSPEGRVRTLVVAVDQAADWELLAALYQGLEEDLALPAPAVSVSAQAGYRLWLSLAGDVALAEARLFLEALQRKYLADLSPASLRLLPDAGQAPLTLVPARHEASGKWSAFIDPSMGAMFVDEPGLEMAPNLERQADMLAGLDSIALADFRRALAILQGAAETPAGSLEQPAIPAPPESGRIRSTLNVGNNFTDPKAFLLAVMNDPSATAGQRIKAARALLPYVNASKDA